MGQQVCGGGTCCRIRTGQGLVILCEQGWRCAVTLMPPVESTTLTAAVHLDTPGVQPATKHCVLDGASACMVSELCLLPSTLNQSVLDMQKISPRPKHHQVSHDYVLMQTAS
jgi:hypothetical protein